MKRRRSQIRLQQQKPMSEAIRRRRRLHTPIKSATTTKSAKSGDCRRKTRPQSLQFAIFFNSHFTRLANERSSRCRRRRRRSERATENRRQRATPLPHRRCSRHRRRRHAMRPPPTSIGSKTAIRCSAKLSPFDFARFRRTKIDRQERATSKNLRAQSRSARHFAD